MGGACEDIGGGGEESTASATATATSTSSSWEASSKPEETRVQSGGKSGREGYTVGLRFMSHGCVFRGLVFIWCAVAFFCGLDEHSITNPTPPSPPPQPLPLPPHGATLVPPVLNAHEFGTTNTLVPNIAEIDMLFFLPQFSTLVWETERDKMGFVGPFDWDDILTFVIFALVVCVFPKVASVLVGPAT